MLWAQRLQRGTVRGPTQMHLLSLRDDDKPLIGLMVADLAANELLARHVFKDLKHS